ncbi:hypothetical protein B0T24DRAFT_532343 [Lasiosphaeria ovina]|uniref:Phosphatidate phosphatase APP1 catalytic domain-containing protein n=1 Tax=Lasiosphaeria ovina TaxID=92902 RepID=A0AAE0K362_9PEZI|nr:hypothetical protein B0T24DRAFT_532343 [Lasiosphaeria ovina]
MTSQYGYGGTGGYGYAPASSERGARRKKLAAMAGSVYRAGVAAASELKEQYNNTRIRGVDNLDTQISIPGSFPHVSIVTKGEEQMVLFPSYAKRHIKEYGRQHRPSDPSQSLPAAQMGMSDEDYWRHEWARLEDEKAVVDVDVRGWIYNPSKGPMTRRNRMLIGLARRLSGIPAPTTQAELSPVTSHEEHERVREEQRIAKEAREIERKGQGEEEAATRGDYSETPRDYDSDSEPAKSRRYGSGTRTPASPPSSPTLSASRTTYATPSGLTEAELAVANANLMARIGPFMTTPLVQQPITIFFYNDEDSQSRTVTTDDSGHFSIRAALDFVPTHLRVLANENISATKPIEIIEPRGVSLISDIDDTIKRSNIHLGAREIFRNTFIRDLADLTVEGVKEWYHKLHGMGVQVHYCSNSPWQLFPVLATFFIMAGLPPGSIHLKHYSGMLQGIFEPVAERKKGTLEKILRDFPERKFLLVGDSGEADLEVYTDLAVANPGRILAVFIRDVTTPDQTGYFDASFSGGPDQRNGRGSTSASIRMRSTDWFKGVDGGQDDRPDLPPRILSAPTESRQWPAMGTLIDLSDEPEPISPMNARNPARAGDSNADRLRTSKSAVDMLSRKAPPPRPTKPVALRSAPSDVGLGISTGARNSSAESFSRSPYVATNASPNQGSPGSNAPRSALPPPPPPRRRGTPSSLRNLSPRRLSQQGRTNSNLDVTEGDPLPEAAGNFTANGQTINKKLDLWRRRLARAHETLDGLGVALYTWRRGEDVIAEAEGLVKDALRDMERGGQRTRKM